MWTGRTHGAGGHRGWKVTQGRKVTWGKKVICGQEGHTGTVGARLITSADPADLGSQVVLIRGATAVPHGYQPSLLASSEGTQDSWFSLRS